jgi:hypothetical protein
MPRVSSCSSTRRNTAPCSSMNAVPVSTRITEGAARSSASTQVRRCAESQVSSWHDQRKYSPRASCGSRLKFHDPPRFVGSRR